MLVRMALLKVVCVIIVSMAICSVASADTIGPGDVTVSEQDTGNPLNVIDTWKPVTLAAGQYKATEFSYELKAGTGGALTPFLATANGDDTYKIVAVGDVIAYDGNAQLFQSHTFGGTDTFAGGTLYAGFYWQSATTPVLCPIGFEGGSGSAAVWTDTGAWTPVKGTTTSVAQYPSLGRAYDFSITVTLIPEPCTLAMIIGLGLGLLAYAWQKRK